jgi:pentatricopeptide repeat protein
VADLDLPPSPTAVSQQIEIPLEVENDSAAATIAGGKTDLLRDVEVESAVEDPDSDIESRQAQRHRLHRRPSGRGKEESTPLVGGTWTVGLRGGKFVRLPNPSRLSSRTRAYSSQAGLSEGTGERRSTTVDDLEMNGPRRAGIQRMRNLGQGKGVNGVDRVRRNSYSAPSRSRESNSSAVRSSNGNESNKPVSKGELGLAESELREELESRDWKKSRRMIQALESGQVETALRLVDEYRNPAALSSDPKISSAPHVEPPYFSQSGYNTVLQILHAFRKVGEPITQVLKAYNEMLERDVLPNIKSYSLVIRSLLERNNEVQVAVRESEAKRKWINWDRKYSRVARKDGTGGGDYSFADRDRALQPVEQQITALKKERNYENAVKLFQSGATYNRHRPFQLAVYSLLMGAAANRGDLETALLAWGHLEGVRNSANKVQETDGHTLVIMYAHLIECYSKTSEGGVEGMQDGLKRFLLDEKNGKINDGRSLDGIIKGTSEDHNLVLRAVCAVFDKLLGGYTVLGEDEKVKSLLELMRKTTKEEERRAGHLIQVNASSISHIADALYDRGEWQKAIELVQEQRKSDLGANLLQRTMRQLGYKALHEENIEAILAISSLMRSVTFSLETPFIRRAVVQLVMLLQQTDLEPELAAKYIGAVDFLSSSWPSTERWNIDSYTVANYVEAAIRHDHPEQAYNMLRQVSKLAAFKSLVITFDITNVMADMEKRVETIRQKLDLMHVMDFTGQGDREAYAKGLVADLLTELPTEAEAMQAWAQESDKGTLAIITRVLTRVGSELNHPLPGDRGVEFDQQSEDLIRRISAVTGEKALSRSDKAMIASLLQHRRGIADARGLLESLYGAETTAGLLGSADSASDISAALSDVTMPLSPGQTSQVSTAPTEHSEDVGAGPVRQYRAAPFSASKQIEQHLGMRPVRTPLESYSLLKGLEEQGELPHPAVIARLSTSMARLGLADKVAELYQYAHAALTHQPDDKRLDAWFTVEDQMLMACCLLGRLEQAGAHRAAILEQNRVPSAESYALMISSAKDTTDDASVARELWEESQNLGVKPTLFLYNTVISKLSRARKAESALDFFKQMKAQGIRPSSVTYGAVINACCRVGDAESAATLFEEMQAIPNHKPRVPPYK